MTTRGRRAAASGQRTEMGVIDGAPENAVAHADAMDPLPALHDSQTLHWAYREFAKIEPPRATFGMPLTIPKITP